jgi:hypothetical protein
MGRLLIILRRRLPGKRLENRNYYKAPPLTSYMERLKNPRVSGNKIPLFYAGTLGEKYSELSEVQARIERISEDPDTRPSERLLDERGELELEISRHLINGEALPNDLMDYCLRNFHGGTVTNEVGNRRRNPSVFDMVPQIKGFMDYVKDQRGEQILTTYGGTPEDMGIISGELSFKINDSFRNMVVPVEKFYNYREGKWSSEQPSGEILVNSDIFRFNTMNFVKGVWVTDHSGQIYLGGPAPEKTGLYIGKENADVALKKGYKKVVPETKEKIVAQSPLE